jgi:hypothetical protein
MIEGLDQLKSEGVLGEADQGALIRHLDDQRETLEARIADITTEYNRRVQAEGASAAAEWLATAARALGEQQGAASRRAVDQLDVSRNV